MRLSVKGAAFAGAIVWSAGILLVGLMHCWNPSYGASFLDGISSIYVVFHGGRSIGDVIVGTILAFVDGGVGGALFAWIYNLAAGSSS